MPFDAKIKTINAVDLFCGAGGTSSGLVNAVKTLGFDLDLLAINHWDIAIATHSKNHGTSEHLCQSIDTINPEDVVPGGRLQLLLASPECTHHSNARGGKPRSNQKRADAWLLLRWIEKLYVENIIIENVKEFQNWGPLTAKGKPDKRHKGLYFHQFIETLKVNYRVEFAVLNAADYGDATSRHRLFIIARRPKHKKIVWPTPTHTSRIRLEKEENQPSLFQRTKLKPWRSAREIIDWSLEGRSIFNRKKPLSENTMKRIFAGLFKYSLKKFLVNLKASDRRCRSVDEPTFTPTANHQYLVEPFLVNMKGKSTARSIEEPAFTQTTRMNQCLAEPFLTNLSYTKNKNEMMCKPLDEPLKTICGKGMLGLIEPYLVKFYGGHDSESINDPIPAITANYEHYGLAEPFIIPCAYGAKGEKCDPRCYSINEPIKTITGLNNWACIQPFLARFSNNQDAEDINEPLKILTTKDKYALCLPQIGVVLDIHFRMLQPHELAAAMGFPKTYHFTGNRQDKVKQIGNAVCVNLAKALCETVLTN